MLGKPMTGPMRPYSGPLMQQPQMQQPMMQPMRPQMPQQQPGILSLLQPHGRGMAGGGRIEPRGMIRNY